MKPDSRTVHAGREIRSGDPLAPPIVQASVQVYASLEEYEAVASGRRAGHVYGRNSNQNGAELEGAVAQLEGAEAAAAGASGMAVIFATVLALAPRPAPVVVDRDAYGVTLAMLRTDLAPLGYEVREVDMADLAAVGAAVTGAAAVLCETITNPLSKVPDLDQVCTLAAAAGAPVMVDNTFASPLLCRPLEHGATVTVHSATKYIGGHSDLLAGVAAGSGEVVREVRGRLVRTGGTLGPFEAWLALRGLRTLALRMRRHSDNSLRLAEALEGAAGVRSVHHPLLPGSPYRDVARRLLPHGSGGMMAIDLEGGRGAVDRALGEFDMVRFAASLGGVETTVSYPALTSHRSLSEADLELRGIGPGTLRVSVGIEDPEDVVADFRRALAVV